MKILIAEDQPVAALYLRRTLENLGHQAEVAPDGEAAWQLIRDGEIPLLISDWMMPRLDGLELCRRLRAVRLDRYIYIILLTSLDRRDDRVKGLRAGADDFLTKPPDPEELAVRLEIAERILAVHDQLARQNALLAELAATDELTGVKNRRRFREDLEMLFGQAEPPAGAPVADPARHRRVQAVQRRLRPPGRRPRACSRSARRCDRASAAMTSWPDTAARNSSCCCRPPARTRRCAWPNGCAPRSPTGPGPIAR